MNKSLIAAAAALALVACDQSRQPAAPPDQATPNAGLLPTGAAIYIVNFDETRTTLGAVTQGILKTGAGVVQFDNFSMVAALATPVQLLAISALPGLQGVYANKRLDYYALHESVASIRADAVHVAGITGKGIGIAILDSGIDGLYNPDVAYPTNTVANVKVLLNTNDLFTFGKDDPEPIRKGATLVVENLPNSETSVGHGTHVAGIAAGRGTASNGYYTGVAPGASLIGIGTGDVLFIFFALAGFDYILDHQEQYNIKVVNNSWGTSGAFDPNDPINEATKTVASRGITVVFAAGNAGPDANTLNPYSVAPWVISVAAGCKLGTDPTNSAQVFCQDPAGREPVLADFSSRGIPDDPLYHPDITAPGTLIVSTRASTGFTLNVLDAPDDLATCKATIDNLAFYTCASGTSMATPHVAGVVALMQEAAGGTLTPDQVRDVLTATAQPLAGYGEWEVGAGYLDAFAAVMAVKQ
jgi:serine protease AprX